MSSRSRQGRAVSRLGLIAVAFSLLWTLPVSAQVASAELSGNVTDASGAAIPNAKVTVVNAATGVVVREVTTQSPGGYTITFLPPGTYTVTAEATGFRKLVQSGIVLQVNQRASLNLELQVGDVTETIEVQAAAPLLESESSSLGSVIGQQFVSQLPLNGRNFVQLAILSPGVNGTGYSTSGTIQSGARPDDRRPGTEIFSNGNREGSNNFLYDGVDNNERLIQLIVYRPAVEAIREFKVQTNLYSADVGRNSGAVVDVISKSGTNELHGSLFYFHRNSAMDARNFFSRPGSSIPPFRYNQYGFSLGGPVVIPKVHDGRNRTFWFIDYEGYRRNLLNTATTTVPTVGMRQGDFSGQPNIIYDPLSTTPQGSGFVRTPFAGNRIPQDRWDPVTAKLINAYPVPQTAGLANNYVAELQQTQDWDQGDIRVDHQFTPNDNFFARWSIQHTTTFAPNTFPVVQIPGVSRPVGVGDEASFAGPAFNPVQHAVGSYVKVLSPLLVNDLRAGFSRFVLNYEDVSAVSGDALGNELGVPNANGHPLQSVFPIFSPAGYTGIGHSRSLPIYRRSNTYQLSDNMTFTTGPHTLKFGAAIVRRQITEYQTNRGNGRFNFSPAFTDSRQGGGTGHSMASFLLGYANLIEQDYTLAWTGQRGWENGLYFADDWRITRRLTLNLGLRWEYYSPYSEVANRIANFDLATATMRIAGRDGVDERLGVNRDFRNFAPRFGFAYQVSKHTVLRGGYGLFYNPNGNGGALLRLFRHVPFGPVYSVTPGDVNVGPRVSDGFPAPPTVDFAVAQNPYGVVYSVPSYYTSAYAQQYNLTVQHEVAPWQMLFKVGYVGNLGRRLGSTYDYNQAEPGLGTVASRRPFGTVRPRLTGVNFAVSDGLSSYHALQVSADKRFSHGFTMLLAYTWSHAIDNVGTEFGGGTGAPQDRRCRSCDRSNSVYDLRHRATMSYTYEFPFGRGRRWMSQGRVMDYIFGGWQLNGITTLQTGLPFTPGLANPNTNGAGGSRPDVNGNPVLSSSERSIARWFDPGVFSRPNEIRFGNAGRNILFGPGRVNFDLSMFKRFAIVEQVRLELRGEAFNIWNTPQFNLPNAAIGQPNVATITSTVGNPRQIQVGARLEF
ncbi:MAG: TonB-dependent receptor [Bryobacteraceae bacterium]|nr:TonB-dependent receptor [Bryobacteraceae bacterium]